MNLSEIAGYDLGKKIINYDERDAVLYALSVGTPHDRLDLVYERGLEAALPVYACARGLWAVEAAGELGAYDRKKSLHASQKLVMHKALPAKGSIETEARIGDVWDKGKASIVNIDISSEYFTAAYSIFLPGLGDWGGERGPQKASEPDVATGELWKSSYQTHPFHAALYRLTGDLYPIHIDTEVAKANGFERPILHGLCTLGIAAREIAKAVDAHPAELKGLEARLAAPVYPGDTIDVIARTQ